MNNPGHPRGRNGDGGDDHTSSTGSESRASRRERSNPWYNRSSYKRMAHHNIWRRALVGARGDDEAARLMERVRIHFNDQLTHLPGYENRALQNHLERSILPGLALYLALLEESGDQDTATSEWMDLFTASITRSQKGRMIRLLRFLPHPFGLFRQITRWTMLSQFPPAGWAIEWVENNSQCLAFNIRDCFYLNVLTSLGAQELAGCFCRLDDVLFETMPSTITWERTKTLALGENCCDFRWCNAATWRS